MCGCLLHAPSQGPGPQPRHVPQVGIEPATLWFEGQYSIYWATPAKAHQIDFKGQSLSVSSLFFSIPIQMLFWTKYMFQLNCFTPGLFTVPLKCLLFHCYILITPSPLSLSIMPSTHPFPKFLMGIPGCHKASPDSFQPEGVPALPNPVVWTN